MRFPSAVVAFVAAPLLLSAADDEAVKKEFRTLKGDWKLVGVMVDGQEVPADRLPQITFSLRADGTAKVKLPEGETTGKMTLDPEKDPKTIDIVHGEGVYEGQSQYAIYKLEGGKLTIRATPPGAAPENRARDFEGGQVMIFERVRDD